MTTRSSSTLDTSSGIVSGKTQSFGDETHEPCSKFVDLVTKFEELKSVREELTSSSCLIASDRDVLCGESLLSGVFSDGFPKGLL